jgi:hypothetical protein
MGASAALATLRFAAGSLSPAAISRPVDVRNRCVGKRSRHNVRSTAARLDPMGRSGNNVSSSASRNFLCSRVMFRRNGFSIDDIRHKHGLAIRARDAFPAKGDIGDLKLHTTVILYKSRDPIKLPYARSEDPDYADASLRQN